MLKKKLTKHGNSLALVIDKPLLDILDIGPDTEVELTIHGKELNVRRVDEVARKKRIQEASGRAHQRYGKVFKRLAD